MIATTGKERAGLQRTNRNKPKTLEQLKGMSHTNIEHLMSHKTLSQPTIDHFVCFAKFSSRSTTSDNKQGIAKEIITVPSELHRRSRHLEDDQQDSDSITCKTDAAWDKAGKKAGFSLLRGQSGVSNSQNDGAEFHRLSSHCRRSDRRSPWRVLMSFQHSKVFSIIQRSSEVSLAISSLKKPSESSPISDRFFSGFTFIVFSHFSRSKNWVAYNLTKQA
ncbi:hypothetical protein YC2023_049574 [Brassica napus]